MSYILDALRRADAQRESDPSRGIHAQPVRLGVGERRSQERYRTGWWAASAAGVAALAFAGWTLYEEKSAAPVAPPLRTETEVAAIAPAPPSVAPAPTPAAAVLPPPVVVAPPVVAPPVVAAAPAAKPAPVSAAPATARPASNAGLVAAVPPRAGPASAPAATTNAPAAALPTAPAVAAPTTVAAPAPVAAEAAAPIAGLPSDAPKLAISGGVYSANAAQRMLIVNGQVFYQGGEVEPGIVLEEIRPKAAVLRFRGSRYSVPY